MHNFSKDDIEALVLIAAKKLNKYDELSNDKEAREKAVNYFQKKSPNEHSAVGLANIALLGVMNVYITEEVQPVVRYSWGNETGAPDRSPYNGSTGGGSALDQVNRQNYAYGDNLGVEAKVVANYLQAGEFDANFVEYLQKNGMDLPDAPTSTPVPHPKTE